MKALGPAPALQDAAGELVDDHDLAVDDGVVHVLLVERLGLERLDQVVDQVAVLGQEHVLDAEELLGLLHAALGDRDRLVLLVDLVVEVRHVLLRLGLEALRLRAHFQLRREPGELVVEVGGLLGLAGDDQRGPRLVDEDVVDLVDDREVMALLELLLDRGREVVPQVVEAELGVRAVDDVAGVRLDLALVALLRLDHADGEAQHLVDGAHPLRVAAGQVVVHRDQVDLLAGDRVQRNGERGGERLALARLHLGDVAVVEDHSADQLDVEMALAEGPLACLAGQREGLVERLVDLDLAALDPLAERHRVLLDLVILEQLHLGLEVGDAGHPLLEFLELLALSHAEGAL